MQSKVVVHSDEARVSTLPRTLQDDYRKRLGEIIDLTPDQEKRLKKWLKARLEEWNQDTEELHRILEEDNDLVEGVVTETDFPFEGASNVHVPVTEMYMETFKSVEKRSILGADVIWSSELEPGNEQLGDFQAQIEEAINYFARNEWNISQCIEDVFWTTNRDGLGIIQIVWCEEYEPSRDIVLISGLDDFITEFPSPEEAGMTDEEYFKLAEQIEVEATPDFPIEIPITFEKKVYAGCKGDVVELVDFVTIPASVPHIKHENCRGYGKRYTQRKEIIRKKGREGVYYEDAAKKLVQKAKSTTPSQYRMAQDEIEGLNRSNKDDIETFDLVIKGRLDGEDDENGERKFLVEYSLEHDILLRCIEFPYRIDNYALFHINKRPNRLIGRSIPRKTRDLNDEIDTQHNQRINTRTISTVPSFKAQSSMKKELDPMLENNKWKPGVIFWLSNFDAFEQFKIQPTDLGESLSEETNDFKILDLYLGSAVALLSGGAAPADPNAPGNKTAIMIQQSNLRMDDPLSELRDGVDAVGEICLSMLYQFGPPVLQFQADVERGGRSVRETRTLHKKYLRRGIKLKMKGVTVVQNPEAEMQKGFQLYQMLMQEPLFQQNAQARIEVIRDALRAGRVGGRTRYMPTVEQVEQQEINLRKQAMIQMQQEQEAAQAQAQEAQIKANLEAANNDLKIKSTARKMAEANLASAGVSGSQNGSAE